MSPIFAAMAAVIKLTLFTTVCSSPCTLRATVQVSAEVRSGQPVCVRLTAEDSFNSVSCWMHNGEHIRDFQIRGIPAGIYTVTAAVKQGWDTKSLIVAGRE